MNKLWNFIVKHPIIAFGLLLSIGSGVMFFKMRDLASHLIYQKSVAEARFFTDVIAEFRTLYTSEVVERVLKQGIKATHDYHFHEKEIPLPATLSILLGEKIGERQAGSPKVRLYSPYPFPWRKSSGIKDEFEKEAWQAFLESPNRSFFRIVKKDGRNLMRFAVADRMRPSCIKCHNSHKDSPKTDWKIGDVRGILEVDIPLKHIEVETNESLRGTLLLSLAISFLGAGAIGLTVKRLRTMSEELAKARDEALASSSAKSRFLATMSHELHTPLNAIIGYSEMMLEEEELNKENKKDIVQIRDAGNKLLMMVDDMLEYSYLGSGKEKLHLQKIDLVALCESLKRLLEPLAQASGTAFKVNIADDVQQIMGDQRKLRICLKNLLSNAFKFTKEGTVALNISKEIKDDNDWVLFVVKDTGIGIDEKDQEAIFSPFSYIEHIGGHQAGGMGLGLALTKELCTVMKGTIALKSELGEGTEVTMRIPADISDDDIKAGTKMA